MFHPLAYLVKLNIEMSMAHLIKIIALGYPHPSNGPSLLLASSSPGGDMLNVDMFAEVPQQRHSLIRGLFGSDHVVFPQEDVRTRNAVKISTGSASLPDYELPSRKPKAEKELDTGASDELNSGETNKGKTSYQEHYRRKSDVPSKTGSMDGGHIVPMPAAVHLPDRSRVSELD
jgi:hypothetical protein